jgi:glycosyltransferase involved in cell wall biosynthesis
MNVSVIIPLYNKELCIQRTVNSILNQTIQSFEIILINDGSTDNSREVVDSIIDPRLRIFDQQNKGVSAARNRGVDEARFEMIAFLDADDEWLPNYLESIGTLIHRHPNCGAYATGIKTIRPNGQVFLNNLNSIPSEPWTGELGDVFALFQINISAFIPSSIVVPKKILLEIGGFPEGVKLLEDISCWLKIAVKYPIAFDPRRLVIYHQDAANRSNIHKNVCEVLFTKTIEDAVRSGQIFGKQRIDAEEFLAQQQIFSAISNLFDGDPALAKRLLALSKLTKRHKALWIKWWVLSYIPQKLLKKLLFYKQQMRKNS